MWLRHLLHTWQQCAAVFLLRCLQVCAIFCVEVIRSGDK